MIEIVPLRKLRLPADVLHLVRILPPHSYIKGGVAREALLSHFSRYDREYKKSLDYDFIMFYPEHEQPDYDEWNSLAELGDVEIYTFSTHSYFKSRDNSLNEVLLGKEGLYFSQAAKRDACDYMIHPSLLDTRPRTILRNILLSLRTGHTFKADVREGIKHASLIDQLIPLLKAYTLGIEYQYYLVLAKHNISIRADQDPDDYLKRLLREWEAERGSPFTPNSPEQREILREISYQVN